MLFLVFAHYIVDKNLVSFYFFATAEKQPGESNASIHNLPIDR